MPLELEEILEDGVDSPKPDLRLWLNDRVRHRLLSNRTYYVRTDGNDANDGLTDDAAGAFLTLQAAADVVHETLDTNGFQVTIQAQAGTYNAGVLVDGPFAGGGPVVFSTAVYPSATIVNATICFEARKGAQFYVQGGWNPRGVTQNLVATQHGRIYFSGVNHGSGGAGCIQVYATRDGYIEAQDSYLISGGGENHVQASHGGNFRQDGGTLILLANVSFSHSSYYALTEGDITMTGSSTVDYNGFTCTAKKFVVSHATIQWASIGPDGPVGSLPGEQYGTGRFVAASDQSDLFATTFTLDMSTTGDQTITMAFWSHEIDWWCAEAGTTAACIGKTVGSTNYALVNAHVAAAGAQTVITTACIYVYDGGTGNIFHAAVTARTNTSITITKAKTGTPTGTLTVALVARRRT